MNSLKSFFTWEGMIAPFLWTMLSSFFAVLAVNVTPESWQPGSYMISLSVLQSAALGAFTAGAFYLSVVLRKMLGILVDSPMTFSNAIVRVLFTFGQAAFASIATITAFDITVMQASLYAGLTAVINFATIIFRSYPPTTGEPPAYTLPKA